MSFLDNLRSRRDSLQNDLDGITNSVAEANPPRDLTDAEQANVRAITEELAPLDERIRQMSEIESRRLTALDEAHRLDNLAHGVRPVVSGPARSAENQSWGEQFIASGALQEYVRQGSKGTGRAVEVSGSLLRAANMPNLITSADVEGFAQPMRLPELPTPVEAPSVLNLIRRGSTTSSVIQYPMDAGFTNNAAVVAEGAAKPQSALNLTTHTAVVGTVAHWVAITRQALEDAPMLRTYIDTRLRDGIIERIENMVLNGDASNNVPGLLSGALTVSGADLWATVLLGVAALQNEGWQATGVVANGADFFSLLSEMRQSGQYDSSLITDAFPYRIFGLPLMVGPSMPAGQVLIGDFARGAQLWDRHATSVYVADQHGELFISNVLLVLAEWRGTVTVYAPHAFALGTITPPATPPPA